MPSPPHPPPIPSQPADDPYQALTCKKQLKWKFAHLNSVDFKLQCVSDSHGEVVSTLLVVRV